MVLLTHQQLLPSVVRVLTAWADRHMTRDETVPKTGIQLSLVELQMSEMEVFGNKMASQVFFYQLGV